MKDEDNANVLWLESVGQDVEQFIEKCDWANAQAGIDALRENGHFSTADLLRKKLLDAQYVYAEDFRFEPIEETEIPTITKNEDDYSPVEAPAFTPSHEKEMRERLLVKEDNRESV